MYWRVSGCPSVRVKFSFIREISFKETGKKKHCYGNDRDESVKEVVTQIANQN